MKSQSPPDVALALESLQSTLEAALSLTQELAGDAVLARLLAAFWEMPAEDRTVVVGALEREVQARALSRATEEVTGQSMVPNPHARLYLRAHETAVERQVLERNEMMVALLRAMRVASIIPAVPEIYASWTGAMREAIQRVDPGARAAVARLVQDVLTLLAEAGAPDAPTPAAGPGARARKS